MTMEQITAVVTIVVTFILGKLAKRFNWLMKDCIPYQNLVIGFMAGIIAYMAGVTDNAVVSVCTCIISAFAAGGVYDLGKMGENNDKR